MQTAEKIFDEYKRGKDYLEKFNYFSNTEDCYRYYNGDQWHGVKAGDERLPVANICRPIVDYKVSTVDSNGFSINYTAQYITQAAANKQVFDTLNAFAAQHWERLKMDSRLWSLTIDAAISGDAYSYFYFANDRVETRDLNNTALFFADEQEPDIQEQKYIIIAQRRFCSAVKEEAKKNGASKEDIDLIMPDEEVEKQIGDKAKQEIKQDDEDGKCICLIKFYKENGTVHVVKCTRAVIYQKDTAIPGMKLYPIAHLLWSKEKGSCRGTGEVLNLISNQIQINKNLARYSVQISNFSSPHLVYDATQITGAEVDKLSIVGSKIAIVGKTATINDAAGYMNPPQIPADGYAFAQNLMQTTRELAGASDAATGQVNPEQASGAAIIAVRDAQALPLNAQKANVMQYIEDVAKIWMDIWCAYYTNGLTVSYEDKQDGEEGVVTNTLDTAVLSDMDISVKIDVSPANPYSKYAQEQNLLQLFTSGAITIDELVEVLPDDSMMPKAKLKQILEDRQMAAQNEMMMQNQALAAENEQMKQFMKGAVQSELPATNRGLPQKNA